MTVVARVKPGSLVVLYDGVCGLCNGLVRFLLPRDREGKLWFAPLQSAFAARVLARHGRDPRDLDTMYLIVDYGRETERLFERARAVLHVLGEIGGIWRLARVFGILPTPLLNLGYAFVARVRYRVFGKYETCPLPGPGERARFVDLSEAGGP
jgi:predicted DCC family thiol-disulfide oxidoreductase YuxK